MTDEEALTELSGAVDIAARETWRGGDNDAPQRAALAHVRQRLFEQQLRGADRPFDAQLTLKPDSPEIPGLIASLGRIGPFILKDKDGKRVDPRRMSRIFRVEVLPNGDVSFWAEWVEPARIATIDRIQPLPQGVAECPDCDQERRILCSKHSPRISFPLPSKE